MTSTCILTDSTAQFPIPAFTGRNLVNIIGFHFLDQQKNQPILDSFRAHDLAASTNGEARIKLLPPQVAAFEEQYLQLGKSYQEIVVITHSVDLGETYNNAKQAAENLKGQIKVEVIDSQTIATGLGLVVQQAAKNAQDGQSSAEISEAIRSLLPRVYTVFCIQGLSYLHLNGYLGQSQALVAEFMKMLPIYVLEEGKLSPTQKARNNRHLVDLLFEFITEFDTLAHIGLIQGVPAFENETRALRERLIEDFDQTPISEHIISPELALMIGPRSLGLFVLQNEQDFFL
jgi:DegV family protein with EDD domain